MPATPQQGWLTQTGSSLVSIGSHRLVFSMDAPPLRTVVEQLVVVLTGAADVASSYTALLPLVAQFAPDPII